MIFSWKRKLFALIIPAILVSTIAVSLTVSCAANKSENFSQNKINLTAKEKFLKNVGSIKYWGDGTLFKDGYYDLLSKGRALKKTIETIENFEAQKNKFLSPKIVYEEYWNNLEQKSYSSLENKDYLDADENSRAFWRSGRNLPLWFDAPIDVWGGFENINGSAFTFLQFLNFNPRVKYEYSGTSKKLISGSIFSDVTPVDAAVQILFGWPTDVVPIVKFSDLLPNTFEGVQKAFDAIARTEFYGYYPDQSEKSIYLSTTFNWVREKNDEKYFDENTTNLLEKGEKRTYTIVFSRDSEKIPKNELWMNEYHDFRKTDENIKISMVFEG